MLCFALSRHVDMHQAVNTQSHVMHRIESPNFNEAVHTKAEVE